MPDSSRFTKPAQDLLKHARTKLWSQAQWPDPDLLYQQNGLFALVAFLQQCWSPDRTKEILARYGAEIHPEAWPIGPNVTIHEAAGSFANLSVGAYAHIGKQVFLDLSDRLVVEDGVSVGMRAMIITHLNMGDDPDKPVARLIPRKRKPTILRRGCSVGAGAVILCGVEVGEHAVINAGVVVDRDVPARTIVSSTPQRPDYQMPERFFRKG